MMCTIRPEVSVTPLLETLCAKSCSANTDTKVEKYKELAEYLKDSLSDGHESVIEQVKENFEKLMSQLTKDVVSSHTELVQASLQTLGFILFHEQLTGSLSIEQCEEIIQAICEAIKQTSDKTACTRALWCLSKQTLDRKALIKKLPVILTAIENGQCHKNFQSMTVEHEALNALIRLLEQIPTQMAPRSAHWGKLVYPLLVHGAPRVREQASLAMDIGLSYLQQNNSEIAKLLVADLKSLLITEMKKLMSQGLVLHVLKVWGYYVSLLGKCLHSGSLINQILPLVEQGFKNSDAEIKVASYRSWVHLIDNFSINPDIISDQKRVKLIMQVFRINNAKFENVAIAKLKSWWHFVCKLGDRITQHTHFEQVCSPLLQFCFSGHVTSTGLTPGKTPSRHPLGGYGSPSTPNLGVSGTGGSAAVFISVQKLGAEVLAMLIGGSGKVVDPPHKFTLERLPTDILSNVPLFIKHGPVIMTAVKECYLTVGGSLTDSLSYHIWYSLVAHIKNVLESSHKKEAVEIFSLFLETYKDVVESQAVVAPILLKMMEAILCLPPKILGSSSFHVGGASSGSSNVMQGCPALFLINCLFNQRIVETSCSEERWFTLLKKLFEAGAVDSSAVFEFTQTTLKNMSECERDLENKETLWRMWSLLVERLEASISQTNEVNQGNNLEHDFSCLYETLQFPIKHIIKYPIPQPTVKSLLKSWDSLYTTFARLASLVANAESNICCEELCSAIHNNMDIKGLENVTFVDCLVKMLKVVLDSVHFSDLNTSGSLLSSITSPAHHRRKKLKPLGNLNSLVVLLGALVDVVTSISKDQGVSPSTIMECVTTLSVLFTHLPSSNMIPCAVEILAQPVSQFFKGATSKIGNKMYPNQVMVKLEKLWLDIITCVQGKYNGPYDTELLQQMSPLLKETFLHSRRHIKNQTFMFWNATFAHAPPLSYPDDLKAVLVKVKERTPIVLPGFMSSEVVVLEDTPLSQMSQGLGGDTQVDLPEMVAIAQGHKVTGSFLNKPVSPNIKKSPLKPFKSPAAHVGSAKKKLSTSLGTIDTASNQEFVVIKSSPKKKLLLTEHQKEVMRENKRSGLPAMYNNLEASQDTNLMAAFIQEESQSQMPTQTPEVNITPFPFSSVKKQKLNDGASKPTETAQDSAPDKEPEAKSNKRGRQQRSVKFFDDKKEKETQDSVIFVNDSLPNSQVNNRDEIGEQSVTIVSETVPDEQDNSQVVNVSSEETDTQTKVIQISDSEVQIKDKNVDHNESGGSNDKDSEETTAGPSQEGSNKCLVDSQDVKSTPTKNVNDALKNFFKDSPSRKLRSSPSVRSSPRRQRLSKSQEAKRTPTKSPLRRSNSVEMKSPKGKQPVDFKNSLDKWLVKSPPQKAPESEQEDTNKSKPTVLVEETQDFSPNMVKTTSMTSDVLVEETPQKSDGEDNKGSVSEVTKDLFADDKSDKNVVEESVLTENSMEMEQSMENSMETEQSEITVIEKPVVDKAKDSNTVKKDLKGPVVKLQRLSKEDVKRFSPARENKLASIAGSGSQAKHVNYDKSTLAEIQDDGKVKDDSDVIHNSQEDVFADDTCKENPSNSSELSFKSQENNESGDRTSAEYLTASQVAPSGGLKSITLSESTGGQDEPMETGEHARSTCSDVSEKTILQHPNWLQDSDNSDKTATGLSEEVGSGQSTITPKRKPGRPKKSLESPNSLFENTLVEKPKRGRRSVSSIGSQNSQTDDSVHEKSNTSITVETQNTSQTSENNLDILQPTLAEGKSEPEPPKKKRGRPFKKKPIESQSSQESECSQSQSLISGGSSQSEPEVLSQGNKKPSPGRKGRRKSKSKSLPEDTPVEESKEKNKDDSFTDDIPLKDLKKGLAAQSQSELDNISVSAEKVEPSKHAESENSEVGTESESQASQSESQASQSDEDSDDDLPISAVIAKKMAAKKNVANKRKNTRPRKPVALTSNMDSQEKENNRGKINEENTQADIFALSGKDVSSETGTTLGESKVVNSPILSKPLGSYEEKRLVMNMRTSPKFLRSNPAKRQRSLKLLNRSFDSLKKTLKKRKRNRSVIGTEIADDVNQMEETEDQVAEIKDNVGGAAEKSSAVETDYNTENADVVTVDKNVDVKEIGDLDEAKLEVKILNKSDSIMDKCDKTPSDKTICDKAPSDNNSPVVNNVKQPQETPKSGTKFMMKSRAELILHRSRLIANKTGSPSTTPSSDNKNSSSQSTDEEVKSVFAKPSILKKSPRSDSKNSSPAKTQSRSDPSVSNSPPSSLFRPIHLPKIYSPSASPSAGILKRRRLSEGEAVDSPSPPNKQRRVSFMDSVETRVIGDGIRNKRVVRRTSSPKPVNRVLDLPRPSPLATGAVTSSSTKFVTHSKTGGSEKSDETQETIFAVPKSLSSLKKDTQTQQDSVQSTQESQLDHSNPIYPALVSCTNSIDPLLAKLTSSVWVRGLGQFMRSQKIQTVGDLSRMSEYEVHNLPIKTPKVTNVKEVLAQYAKHIHIKESLVESLKGDALPNAEEELDKLTRSDMDASLDSEALDGDLCLAQSSGDELTEDIQMLENNSSQSSLEDTTDNKTNPENPIPSPAVISTNTATNAGASMSSTNPETPKQDSVNVKSTISQIRKLLGSLTPEMYDGLSSKELVQLNSTFSVGVSDIALALQKRCPTSPGNSQSSQES